MNKKYWINYALIFIIIAAIGLVTVTGCSIRAKAKQDKEEISPQPIYLVTREEGSGTRDAFVELTGVLEKGDNGTKRDNTSVEATVLSSTQAVMSNVADNNQMIGYISLGSLNSSVKALKVNNTEPTFETIKGGSYVLARPFNVAYKGELKSEAGDFMNYLMSNEAQKIVEETGYVSVDAKGEYKSNGAKGKVVIAGSSSVSPVMEKIAEAYMAENSQVTVEIQTTDSSSGMTAVAEGTCDIGMASRALKDSELDGGLKEEKMAMDGIVIVVSHENTTENLTLDELKSIYTGKKIYW